VSRFLATTTWPQIAPSALVLVPIGSVEQHGPHLPLDTDTVIAAAVTHRVADLLDRPDVLVAPPVAYGASGEHQSFPGTASIGTEALTQQLVELTRSLRTWADRVLFINAHGGNTTALTRAVCQLITEGHDVAWVPCATEDVDAHAGFTETSLMLHLRPWDVRLDRAEAGNTRPIADLLPTLITQGVRAVSENGVLGDPAGATAAEGKRVLETMAEQITRLVNESAPDDRGMLHAVKALTS
jgi:mycofactocin system creatininase family protein